MSVASGDNDYYAQLYDVHFFAASEYTTSVPGAAVRVRSPGTVEWDTYSGSESVAVVREAYERMKDGRPAGLAKSIASRAVQLAVLLLAEEGYRNEDWPAFNRLLRLLWTQADSNSASQLTRVRKLTSAARAVDLLSQIFPFAEGSVVDNLCKHAVEYVNANCGASASLADVRVENPVAEDFAARNTDISSESSLLDFYASTHSYVLELTAANLQVETLSNYVATIQVMRDLGVAEFHDYGGGIGTFVALASAFGIQGTYWDMESCTRQYAETLRDKSGNSWPVKSVQPSHVPFIDTEAIVCTEVLEHVDDPDRLLHAFDQALRPQGLLVLSESFDYVNEFATHLPKHRGRGGATFTKFMAGLGYAPIRVPQSTHVRVFAKLA